MKKLIKSEIVSFLARVKEISETHRNPKWGDNPRRRKGGKVCMSAAAAADLGSSARNRDIPKRLRQIVDLGYLKEIPGENYIFFQLTDEGSKLLASSAKSKKK